MTCPTLVDRSSCWVVMRCGLQVGALQNMHSKKKSEFEVTPKQTRKTASRMFRGMRALFSRARGSGSARNTIQERAYAMLSTESWRELAQDWKSKFIAAELGDDPTDSRQP
eukprot:3250154-Rhodomonas_salina.2